MKNAKSNMQALDMKKPSGTPSGTKAWADQQKKPNADKWRNPNG